MLISLVMKGSSDSEKERAATGRFVYTKGRGAGRACEAERGQKEGDFNSRISQI